MKHTHTPKPNPNNLVEITIVIGSGCLLLNLAKCVFTKIFIKSKVQLSLNTPPITITQFNRVLPTNSECISMQMSCSVGERCGSLE